MSKAEEFIESYTRNCSNEIDQLGADIAAFSEYHPWITPDQARRAVEIAREETLLRVVEWIKDAFIFSPHAKDDFSQTFNVERKLL